MKVVFIPLLIVGIFYCSANDLRLVKERIRYLENRVNTESKFRHDDYSEIIYRLGEIDKVLNTSLDNRVSRYGKVPKETNETSSKAIEHLKQDLTRIRKAFGVKKAETARIQRENNKRVDAIAANVEINKANIERVYSLVTELSTNIKPLLRQMSCMELLQNEITQSGTYQLRNGLAVNCDPTDGGGWIVFQRRLNGEVDFYRNWTDYKNGFGDFNGEFWLGNDHLSLLTADGEHELRIEMEDFDGKSVYAEYSKFKIYPEEENYKLEVSGYSGTAGHALKFHSGMMFSTFDRDNDKYDANCALDCGAWWYDDCYHSNLNGKYYNTSSNVYSAIRWRMYTSTYMTARKVEMKFRKNDSH